MSGIVQTYIFVDGLRDRESVAGSIAGALRDLEARADQTGERIIWSSISLDTETDYSDEISFAGTTRHRWRRLNIGAHTIDPTEINVA